MQPDDPFVIEAVRQQILKSAPLTRNSSSGVDRCRSARPGRIRIVLKALREAGFGVCIPITVEGRV